MIAVSGLITEPTQQYKLKVIFQATVNNAYVIILLLTHYLICKKPIADANIQVREKHYSVGIKRQRKKSILKCTNNTQTTKKSCFESTS